MAYCPNCAAVLDPTQKFCARCGQPSAVFAPMPPLAAVGGDRPSSVTLGTGLYLITIVIGVLSTSRIFLTPSMISRLPFEFFLRFFGILVADLVFLLCIWKRQGWARFALGLILLWGIGSLITTIIRISGTSTPPTTFALPIFEDLLRIGAFVLLFKPESNAWFKR